MGYIYVMTNTSIPGLVKIGYADDVGKRLKKFNSSEFIPHAFRVFATLEVPVKLADKKVHDIIDSLKPELRAVDEVDGKKRKREFFEMSPEEAYRILKSISAIFGSEDKLTKYGEDTGKMNLTLPKKTKSIKNSTYIKVARSNTDIGQIKPELPSKDLGPCDFARTAFEALLASGYVFSDEQIKVFSTVEGSKAFIRSKKWSLFWLLKEGETRSTFDEKVRDRYWAEVYTSGHYRFMMYSQWYKDHKHGPSKEDFINWYNEL